MNEGLDMSECKTEAEAVELFVVLGRFPDKKRFMLLGNGCLTTLRVHAVIFRGRERAESVVTEMREHHPEAEWKLRKIK